MNLIAETVLYALQFASVLLLAGPVLARGERQRTFSRNPEWAASNREFYANHGKVSTAPFKVATALLAALLVWGISNSSSGFVFAVHGPVFLLTALILAVHYHKQEGRLRDSIPKHPLQRASIAPRLLSNFISAWSIALLSGLYGAAYSLNGFGLYAGSMASGRIFGNLILTTAFVAAILFGVHFNLKRRPYRTSAETDGLARKFELRLIFAAGYFLAAVAIYHAVGSLGPRPFLPYPPTMVHAWVEGSRFSWEYFFKDFHYRVVDYAATVFLIGLAGWIFSSRFYQHILRIDFNNPPEAFKV